MPIPEEQALQKIDKLPGALARIKVLVRYQHSQSHAATVLELKGKTQKLLEE